MEINKNKNKNLYEGLKMSEIIKCPGCNLRKRKLYSWFDKYANINTELCEDCIFLREFEEELTSDLDNENNQRVLIDYEAFGVQKQKIFPYKWLLYHILKAYLDRKEEIVYDDLIEEWGYKNEDLDKDIIPKFIEWNIVTSPQIKNINNHEVKIIKFGSFLDNILKTHLNKTIETGKFESLGNILRLVEGRIGFGIETKTSFKDRVRQKLMKIALNNCYDRDTGEIKDEVKVIDISEFRCKICNEVSDFRYKIYKHIETAHPEIKKDEIDDKVIVVRELKGIKILREKIANLDELKTYGASWRVKLAELFKRESFFEDSDITREEPVMVISAPWAEVIQKVNMKIKNRIKAKDKLKA